MNVRVVTVFHDTTFGVTFTDATFGLSDTVLQVTHGAEMTTFPLANLISFTTSEQVSS